MRIAVIAPTEIPTRRANSIQVMKMTEALALLGHEVRLVAPAMQARRAILLDPDNPTYLAEQEISWQALETHYGLQRRFPIQWLPAQSRWRRYDYALHALRWAQSWNAEVIYTRLPQAATLASSIGLPTILEVHDIPMGKFGTWLLRRFLKGRSALRLVVVSRALAEALASQYQLLGWNSSIANVDDASRVPPKSFTIIAPDGVDLRRYADSLSTSHAREFIRDQFGLHLPDDAFIAGYTGHLYSGRGTQLILRLAKSLPEFTFLLVGGEVEAVNSLQSQVVSNGINNLIITGFIPNARLPYYQAACDVLMMPYQHRVAASSGGDIARYLSPMKLFEYLACGRAILSSDLPVLQEVLNSSNAILLPAADHRAWVNALIQLRSDVELRDKLANQARQDAQQYIWEARAARIFAGIEDTIGSDDEIIRTQT